MSRDIAIPTRAGSSAEPGAKAVLYLRVSSKKQMDTAVDIDPDGNSIATQREVSTRKANNLGAAVVHEFVEPGVSAATIEKRQAFQDMLAFLRENSDVRYVIVYARSRAFRNYIDAAITKRLLDKLNVKLVSAREDFGDGVYADMMEAVTDIFNDVQNKLSGEDIRIKLQHKAINGGTTGRAPIGYLNTRTAIEGRLINTVSLDPIRAPLVLKAWELYATGDYSIERLTATMADLGLTSKPTIRWPAGRPLSDTQMHRMLGDPYYAGFVVFKGDVYPGRHEPIIGQDLFERVQEVQQARSGRGNRDRILQHYLKGMLFCQRCYDHGRTSRLIYTEAKGRSKRYGYFLCRARQDGICDLPHIAVARVEQAVIDHYITLQPGEEFVTQCQEKLDDALADAQGSEREAHAALRRRPNELNDKEARLIDLAADGTLPTVKIRAKLNEIKIARARVEAGLTTTADQLSLGAGVLRDALRLVADIHQLYLNGNSQVRGNLNDTFFEKLYIDDCEVVHDELKPPFVEIAEASRVKAAVGTANARTKDAVSSGSTKNSKTAPPGLAGIFLASGSSKAGLVGRAGLEPATNGL
ncbi:recombinase family protein [Mycolicibacterium agri]|uniref:Recombinase n=1 Tax=Mycolicibacterium agri TaxID=36811 RepID=A0A2A7MTW4_MYCAG|nr:recombinase family protein [Mycolicibacterium agri]PEG34608.1 recombinase family protein [Mycolicibacterium agri]GFG50806.1 recombinase [Mycolicibacterium agri]